MTYFINDKTRIVAGTDTNDAVTLGQLTAQVIAAKARANHTGTQLAATISDLPAVLDARIALLVNGAPAAFDTLKELADAIAADETGLASILAQLTIINTNITALQALPHAGRSLSATIGDGVATLFNIDHNWALTDPYKLGVELVNRTTGENEIARFARQASGNRLIVEFTGKVPAVGEYSVLLREIP